MRKSSSSSASRVGNLIYSLLLTTASLCILPGASAFNFTAVPSPNLDLNDLGRVAVGGNFDSISLYEFVGQNQNAAGPNGALLSRFPNGVFATLDQTDGDITSMCPFVANGTLQGIVFGGNFTSVGGMNTPGGVALLNPNTSVVTPLPGLNGSVNALYCDANAGRVYIGGSFTGGGASNAIVWITGWTNMPFAGFNGPVNSIAKTSNGNIIFGGKFNGLGNATAPRENDAQVIPVGSANITSSPESGTVGFIDPRNIICKTGEQDGPGNTWLLADNTPGFWQADFGFGFQPSKLRLYNTKQDGRGTKTWRYTALPINGIMNFSYVDPSSGTEKFCDATCPLPEGNTSYQDFRFVNTVGMNSFRIDISAWYGSGAGLAGIELFENDIYSFAIQNFNEPQCDGVSTGANSTATGSAWVTTPSGDSNSQYLTAVLTGNDINPDLATVVFKPDIKQSGNYSVTVFTPGCKGDNTCNTRGQVNITGSMTSSTASPNQPLSTTLFQTNDFDKYDQVYFGYIDASDDGFRPSVTLAPASGQSGQLTVVAQRVRFELLTPTDGDLNGLFEYNASQQVVDADFTKSAIDAAGASLSPREQALITALTVEGDTTYIAGNFSGDGFSNIFSIGAGNATSLPGNGLNNQVMTMYQNGSTIYVGGNFTNTQDGKSTGINGVVAYSTSDKNWQPLGAGVNGVVTYVVPFTLNLTANQPETVLGISGIFDMVNGFGSNSSFSVQDFAIWVPSRQNWLNNLDIATLSIEGVLMAQTDVPGSSPLFSGSISSQDLGASGAVELDSTKALALQSFGVKFSQQQSSSSLRKRATTSQQSQTGVVAATFYHENDLNITIWGGNFATTGSDGSNITNLLFINSTNGDAVTGAPEGIESDSIFKSFATSGTTLYAGGEIVGKIDGDSVDGIVAYDLRLAAFNSTQPPGLQGTNVSVNAIAVRPESTDVYVGGNFASAGSLSCPSVCLWSADRGQWVSPGSGISGTVSSMVWTSNTELLIAGNLTIGGNATYLATFNSKNNQFTTFTNAGTLPGPVTALCAANSDASQLWVSGTSSSDGSSFVQKFNGKQWVATPSGLGQGTIILGLQVLSLSSDHSKSDLIDSNEALLLLGQINVTSFGAASGVLFNGTTYQPFLLATSQNNAGTLSQVFVENSQNFFGKGGKHLAVGFIVLIALAIALALTFLLVVAGILLEWYRKRREGYDRIPQTFTDKSANMSRIPPEHLFGTLGNTSRAPAI